MSGRMGAPWTPAGKGMKHELRSGPEPHYDRVVSGYETFHSPEPFPCEWGGVLPGFSLAYETWGTLSPRRDKPSGSIQR